MRITKYQHACFTVEVDGQYLVIDPGNLTEDFVIPSDVVGIIVTHVHDDHLDQKKIDSLLDSNPEAVIIGPQSVINRLENTVAAKRAVQSNDKLTLGPFELGFYGGLHATIYREWPDLDNLGVSINDRLYYPGDSFALSPQKIEVLALPVAAPWMKISEAMDFFKQMEPKLAFPTHDAILSKAGQGIVDHMLSSLAQQIGADYRRLSGETIDID